MLKRREPYRHALIALGLLLMVACSATPQHQATIPDTFPHNEAEDVFSAGFDNIAKRYIERVTVEQVALEGARGLATLDPAIMIARDENQIVLRYSNKTALSILAPAKNDVDGWAHVVMLLTAESRRHSSELSVASAERLYEAVFDGAVSTLDVYSRYAGADEAGGNRAQRDGFGGIGIRFRIDDAHVLVTEVMPETPAEHAGILVGDVLSTLQGKPLGGLASHDVVTRLRGPIGSSVELGIERHGLGNLNIRLERNHIVPATVSAKMLNGIVYVRIKSFNQGTTRSVSHELRKALESDTSGNDDVKGIILDLRGNPGGLLNQSVQLADTFLVHGDILNTLGRHPDSIQHYEAAGQDQALGLPMVVLIDGKSASAAEIVAAALQDRERAVIVGTASYGKGTVQTVIRLPNDGELTLTWSRFMTPSGYALHGLGVYPMICTSGGVPNAENGLEQVLDNSKDTLDIFDAWRETLISDTESRGHLRTLCPPERHTNNDDIKIARRLIEDGTLYMRALQLAASTAETAQ